MARETAREVAIQDSVATPIYQDQRQIVRGLGAHLTEMYAAKVVGAGGAGGSITEVPFEPAVIEVYEPTGPTMVKSIFAADGAVHIDAITGAANATPPTKTQVGEGNWTVGLPTALAPDGDTATVLIYGFRDVAGSL